MKKVLLMAVLMFGASISAMAQDVKALNEEVKALKGQWDKANSDMVLGKGDNTQFYALTLQLFQKFKALDKVAEQPDAKGKVKNSYRKGNAEVMHQYRAHLVNGGLDLMNADKNEEALVYFDEYISHATHPMTAKYNYAETDSLMYQTGFFGALAAARIEKWGEVAKFATYGVRDAENGNSTLQLKCQALKSLGNNDEWIAAVKEGLAKFPGDTFYSANLVDYYMSQNNIDGAIAYIDEEIGKNPGNYYNYYMKGFMLNQQKKYDAADEVYAKACSMNDDMVQLYSYAGLNLCQAAIELGEAENADQNKINDYYKRALPYYTKARQLAPDDKSMWANGLYTIYYRLNMETEFKEIEALM